MSGAAATKEAAPARSLRRSVSALLFLYAVAFAMAVLTGSKCQGEAAWRRPGAGPARESAPPNDR